jgi:hypothetical protein
MPDKPLARPWWLPHLLASLLLLPGLVPRVSAQTYLASLEGPPVTVRYSPGSLDRADGVKLRFERLIEQTGKRRWWKQPLLVVELVEADAWRRAGLAEPFGLPAISAEGSLALPAWGTPETVAVWRSLLDTSLPSISDTPLRGSSEELASLAAADLVGEVEGSRLVLARLGLSGVEPWVNDLLACALTVSALQEYEAVRRAETHQLFAALAKRGETYPDERLKRLRWIAAAERIGVETGRLPAKPLLKLARKQSGPLPAAVLLESFPWLAEWLISQQSN